MFSCILFTLLFVLSVVDADDLNDRQLCAKGNVTACTRLCDGGNAEGCSGLGKMYHSGKGVKKDIAKAKEFLGKACDGGETSGCSMLGAMYYAGEGGKKDYFKAVELFNKACDLKDQKGCERYAILNK